MCTFEVTQYSLSTGFNKYCHYMWIGLYSILSIIYSVYLEKIIPLKIFDFSIYTTGIEFLVV